MNQEFVHNFVKMVEERFGKTEFTIKEVREFPANGFKVPGKLWGCKVENQKPVTISLNIFKERYGNGEYQEKTQQPHFSEKTVQHIKEDLMNMYIPGVNPDYIPAGENYNNVLNIVSSGEFFPCYIYGISGVGKTSTIEHVCSVLQRPFFRVQITQETVDEDLIGSMKLVNGNTVWQDGPVIKAYRLGGVCVLDECDLNSNLMILQPILEKKPFYIKQTGELVEPKDGFTVFATGNTKGDGSDPRFIGTTVLNDAFLERFAITLEQSFLSKAEETKIAKKFCTNNNIEIDPELLKDLMRWVEITRETYVKKQCEGVYISTRRIGFILKAYKITQDIEKALDMTLTRYEYDEKEALMMIWKSLHVSENQQEQTEQDNNIKIDLDELDI